MSSLGSPTLDCFRNGSVVQLKSKVSGRTLTLEEGGHVHSNGSVGYYAGCLGPRTPVWGRWTNETYYRGTISNVDTQVHIKFNDGDTISHDTHDQTAVVADVDPDPEVVQVGSRVIAQFHGSARYYPGRVTKVDRANPRSPRCDIQFDDGDKDSASVNQMRMLPDVSASSLEAPSVAMNSRVLGRWSNNQYYRGRVTGVGGKIDVQFDDGDRIQHDPSDISAVIYDVNPRPGTIQVGSRVIGFWPNINKFYLGKATQVDYMNPQSPRYFVQFDDGDQGWCNLNEIRPVPLQRESVGCIVWGRWTNDNYYHGRVTSIREGKVHVTFDDGDTISHDVNDASGVIVDVVPNPAHVPVGSHVIAAWPGRSKFYKGRVTQIDSSNFYAPRYYVSYLDGDQGWVNFNEVRLLPMRVNEVGASVWGRWTNGQYYRGKVERVDSKIHILFDDGDRISHSPSDVTAIVLDTASNPGLIARGSRVIAAWQGSPKMYLGTVMRVDNANPYEVKYHIFYDDGDKGWVNVNQLHLLPSPGPANEAQFSAIQIGGNVVALRNVANPHYYLGVEGGRVVGKMFDNYCHFYVHETPDHYVSLEFCMLPGQHIGVNRDGTVAPPASTPKSEQAFFEVKLLFSPYGQVYSADHHSHGGGYPAPTPGYPQPGSYPTPPGGYPGGSVPPPQGGYPGGYPGGSVPPPQGEYPGGCPGGYPAGSHPPPPAGGYPGGYPAGSVPPPQGGYPGGYPAGSHQPPPPGGYPGGYPAGSVPPPQGGYPGGYPTGQHPPPGGYPNAPPQHYPGTYPPGAGGYPY